MAEENHSPPMFKWYTRYYAAINSSTAHAEYCRKVYGRDLCQHGFAEMAHLDHLIEVSRMDPSCRVLDLGCGNGMISEYISDQTGAHVIGIDFIPDAIRQALERTVHKREHLDFLVMDMTHLVFEPDSFDAIISVDTLYFGDAYEILRQAFPLLKPGGRLVAFFDQSCGPDTSLEDYPRESCHPDRTDLAVALQRLGVGYQYWDYTQAMLDHLRRRRPVLAALQARFEAEGNEFLFENHIGEANGIEHAYTHDAGNRYLYLTS